MEDDDFTVTSRRFDMVEDKIDCSRGLNMVKDHSVGGESSSH